MRGSISPAGAFKQAYSGMLFAPSHFNLGSHSQRDNFSNDTNAAIVYYHARSYDDMIRVTIQTCIGHGFIAEGDSKGVMLQKTSKLMEQMPRDVVTNLRACAMASCHKVWILYDDLVNHEAIKAQYYENSESAMPILRGWEGRLAKLGVLNDQIIMRLQSQLVEVQQNLAAVQQHERQLLLVCLLGVAGAFAFMRLKRCGCVAPAT